MNPSFIASLIFAVLFATSATKADEASAAFEKELAAAVAGSQVTVVHLWAPWCSNCKAEMTAEGWAKFVKGNPAVKVVFVSIWHEAQPAAPKLAAAGLGGQKNFVALTHPNPSNDSGTRVEQLLGFPITWIPTTWIFRDGKMRYALNYGEMRFPILQQLAQDAGVGW